MPDKRTHGSPSQCIRHRAIKSTPQTTTYTWHDVRFPSANDSGGQRPTAPQNRCKHAACLHGDHIYIYGGRNGGTCHGDLWRYCLSDKTWLEVTCRGDPPQSPQEHTLLAYKNNLYLFGGQFWCSYDNEAPLWILNLETLTWKRNCMQSEVLTPGGRRGHTAVIHDAVMYIFGGYIDLKGSSNELWLFDLEAEMWHLNSKAASNEPVADARHGHSAVVYDGAMFVYGGMSNLVAKDDLWQYHFKSCHWTRIKSRPSPPPLKGHTACVIADQMLVFGGTTQGSVVNTLWCFHFGSSSWCRISTHGSSPPATLQHVVVVDLAASDGIPTGQQRVSSHPQLQSNRKSSSSLEPRPHSSPASLTSHHVVETEISTSLIKNKVVPSGSPQDFDGSSRKVSCSPDCCPGQEAGRNHTILRDAAAGCLALLDENPSSGNESTYITELSSQVDNGFHDIDNYVTQAFSNSSTVNSVDHVTLMNCPVMNGNPVHAKALGKHKYERLSEFQENRVTLFDDTPQSHSTLFAKDTVQRTWCSSDADLMTHSVIVADDLQLEDIEDDEILSSLYLGGATSQYIMNDSLASSTDLLNLSNSSETTHLVNQKTQHKAGQQSKRTCAGPPCLTPSKKTQSEESLPYGVSNPIFGIENNYLSSSIKELRNSCGDFMKQSSLINPGHQSYDNILPYHGNDTCVGHSSPDVSKNCLAVKEHDGDLFSEACTIFSNPCYFSEFDHDTKETIEMCDLKPLIGGVRSEMKKNVFSACEDKGSSHQMCELKEMNGRNETDNGKVHPQQETVRRSAKLVAKVTPVLTPALPLLDHHRLYYMYIIGGQTAECKRFGYNPINLWQLTVALDRR